MTTAEFAIPVLSASEVQGSGTSTRQPQADELLTTARRLRFDLKFADASRATLELIGSGNEPTAFWRVLSRIAEFSRLPAGWDSYGAQPLNLRAVRRCFMLLPSLLQDGVPDPTVILTREGGLQLEWHRRGIDLELTIPPSEPLSYYFANKASGEEAEGLGAMNPDSLRRLLTALSQAA